MKKLKEILDKIGMLCSHAFTLVLNLPNMIKRKIMKSNTTFAGIHKKGLACMLAAAMLITALPLSGIIVNAEGDTPIQDIVYNEETNTYEIYTAKGLCDFRDKVNGYLSSSVKLMNDIDLSSVCGENINGEEISWLPMGMKAEAVAFTGLFDGQGFTISNLYIHTPAESEKALFGYLGENAVVKDLTVKGNITADEGAAGIAYQNSGKIENCTYSGSVSVNRGVVGGMTAVNNGELTLCVNHAEILSANSTATGGIVGVNNKTVDKCDNKGQVTATGENVGGVAGSHTKEGTITSSSNNANVGGTTNVGGVCGEITGGTISLCYNAGAITGTTNAGGNVGQIASGSLENCYNAGAVTGTTNAGGNVGKIVSGSLTNCYNVGKVAQSTNYGGVCGLNEGGTFTNVYYWESAAYNGNDLEGTIKKTDVEMKKDEFLSLLNGTQAIFVKDIAGENKAYPIFSWQAKDDYFGGGTGTKDDPYLIYTPQQLVNFRNASNSRIEVLNAKVMADLDMSSVCSETLGSWIGIYGLDPDNANSYGIRGVFDGNNKIISNLYLDKNNSMFSAILYTSTSPQIKNVTLSNVKIAQDHPKAILVGQINANNVLIENCKVIDSNFLLNGSANFATIAEKSGGATISNCYSNANITIANNQVYGMNYGGICVETRGTITDCVFEGSITSNNPSATISGICCQLSNNGIIKNCINRGNITANYKYDLSDPSSAGGILGISLDNNSSIINCINEGKITNNKLTAGGICGSISLNAHVENCINRGEVIAGHQAGGIVGHTYQGFITNCLNVGTVTRNTGSSAQNDFLGGIVGNYYFSLTATNNYYLDTSVNGEANHNIGTAVSGEVLGSGETTYLLGNAFGQMITGTAKDQYPVFRLADNTNQVLKVSFKPYGGEITDSSYTNYNQQIVIPATYNDGTFGFKTSEGWISETQSITTDLEVTAITKPSYTVTIPTAVDFGDVTRVLENKPESEKIVKTDAFSVSANHSNLFINEKSLTVSVDGSSLKMTNAEGTDVPFYLYFSDATPINSKVDVLKMTTTELDTDVQVSKQFYAQLDQSKLKAEGAYKGTITFTVSLDDIA